MFTDHVYLRHLSTECRSILSADMATDTRPIYRPTLGRYVGRDSVECRSTWTDKHVGRQPADTSFPLGRQSVDTLPTLGQRYAHLVSSCYRVLSSLLYWERLSGAVVHFWPFQQYSCLFSSYVFSSSSLLYTTLVTFRCSSIWGLLLSEARYFRGAKYICMDLWKQC